MPRKTVTNHYQFVEDLVTCGKEVLHRRYQVAPDQAEQMMVALAEVLCQRIGKSMVYIPGASYLANARRDVRISADYQVDSDAPGGPKKYTRERVMELAVRYDLSVQRIYQIIEAQRSTSGPTSTEAPVIGATGHLRRVV